MKNLGLVIKGKDCIQQVIILDYTEKVMLYNEEGHHVSTIFGDRKNKVEIHFIHSYTSNRLITIDLYVNDMYLGGYNHIKDYIIKTWVW